ncbi:MAG: polymerase III, beta subunit protein [Candidatus Yanofskybacteria bacterium GW2011_GWA1_44_21]|uniref:Beta sliding clamp n=3 Tax=Parcubacteria group TaxID=1794811 RepID=A0A0G0XJQ0_9BACT|nr:MAG: polymerase III, beta subunit protein [Candidatus Wolfebacteria bacterium GW2011_GWA2_42_10]KKT50322.1 MAG: polymerase III, beta subunit protein [Candidatus Yanofskybacteria bacterium GW2011_GWA1_44_21]KKT90161.1 MAG: polymerase III, beta subunit protein [Candidatus Yanofskybacteria bacterium GW2011_GWB1_45_11]OGN03406.1 MAG: DNA polymerase III subunit beta [Candidatus Yanofskybacteria bacterium RIFCSPHIGHO2_01_FULL_44_110b]OGN15007.1 MAG: DNA polymerase III subunit beta [Candidatus Yano
MRITVAGENLKKALGLSEKIVNRNTTLPILNNVLLRTENGRLKVSATNLEVGINCFIGSKIDEAGEIAVPAKIFSNLVYNMKDDKLTLTAKNNILHINSQKHKTQILGLSGQDFPIIPKIKSEPVTTLPAKLLKSGLSAVMDAASSSEARPELSGIYIYNANGFVYFVATDSFRLAEKKISLQLKKPIKIILPRPTAGEFIRICSEIEGDVDVYIHENQIAIENDDIEVVSRLIEGSYPDYARIIPENFKTKIILAKEEMENSIRLAGLFSSHVSDITIKARTDNLEVTAKNSDKGEIEEKIGALIDGDDFEITLNYNYLLDGLKTIMTPNVVLEFTGPGSPLVLKPHHDKPDSTYLVMPLRT